MKQEINVRQIRLAAHQHKYSVVKGCSCTYCGAPVKAVSEGSEGDHVPPISTLDSVPSGHFGDMKIVPCCSDCNTLLSDIPYASVDVRRRYVLSIKPLVGKTEAQIIAGAMYNANINEGFKRGAGQVDTPDVMAERILDPLPLLGSFCDPACGDGSFVRMQIKRLIEAGVDTPWIEENVRGYDIDVEMVGEAIRRLRRDFPGLNGKVIFKQKDIFEMNEQFETIVMNPPWSIKVDGVVTEKALWKKFAEAALKQAVTVVVVAPMAAKFCNKAVLADGLRFDGVDTDGCAIEWSRDESLDLDRLPKFDIEFRRSANIKKLFGEVPEGHVVVETITGVKFSLEEKRAIGYGHGKVQTYVRFKLNRLEFKASDKFIVGAYIIAGDESEAAAFVTWASDNYAEVRLLAADKNGGHLNIKTETINAAFSKAHQK